MPKNKKGKGPLGGTPSIKTQQLEIRRQVKQAEQLWQKGDAAGALELLEAILEKHPQHPDPELLFMTGVLYVEIGMLHEGLERAEEADELEPNNPQILSFLGLTYLLTNHPAHALMTYRELRSADEEAIAFGPEERERIKTLEQVFQQEADNLGVVRVKIEQAMVLMERGEIAFLRGNASEGVQYLQQSITMIPKWAAPRNNLTLYLWGIGQAEDAWTTARSVLEELNPEDYQALSNLTFQLAVSGRTDEARQYLQRLLTVFEKLTPIQQPEDEFIDEVVLEAAIPLYFKTAEALAALDEDQQLFDLLKRGEALVLDYDHFFFRLLTAAAWNLGRSEEAQQYWAKIEEDEKRRTDHGIEAAMTRLRPSEVPAWRMPYFEASDLVPPDVMRQIVIFDEKSGSFNKERMSAGYTRLTPYYPFLRSQLQTIAVGEFMLAEATLAILVATGTPEIFQPLQDFALGVEGLEEVRQMTVSLLLKIGQLPSEGEIRFWREKSAEWQQIPVAEFPPTNFKIE
ncbi:MAG: hypothetical protein HXX20_07090 [Chloroflexi bacterium]|nr:hypothetical protein [Chloroflexota bacterium]